MEIEDGFTLLGDDILVDNDLVEIGHGRDFVHDIEHDFFEDRTESACAALTPNRFANDGELAFMGYCELDFLKLEEAHILAKDAVLRFPDNIEEHIFREFIEGHDNGNTSHKLGDEPEFDNILCGRLRDEFGSILFGACGVIGHEAHASGTDALFDDIDEVIEGTGEDEEDVCCVDADEILLSGAIFGGIRREGDGARFDHFEECLLHAFTADIASTGTTRGDFVDFVDADDAAFGLFNIFVGGHPQGFDDVFDIFTDVTGFRQGRRIRDGERDVDELCDRLCDQGFATSRGADHQDIALGESDIIMFVAFDILNAFVVIINGDAHGDFGAFLSNDVLVEEGFDFTGQHISGRRERLILFRGGCRRFFGHNLFAEHDAVITNTDAFFVGIFSIDEFSDVFLFFAAEGAANGFGCHKVRMILSKIR